ncbi:murein biosynthesis integral membrane protein MurJ [Helicobacter cetorum]|uniref:Probable lipid II flippase MurJ n=1 Tax=Helicobacter cetorum (strain ATCC BAA-540 / CCUG 52418 / MIT 99-5656) TaxID=1163745 RepID=I0ER36_HELCM|nr:murein biosynthesis integral membrane protein MurJ [Helicobacter cetorum]AFI05405.1 virulence factor MviN [Helicobacter cetorum MIT 99-5656]
MIKRLFLTNSLGILCSRILGFLRDLMMASILGAGVYSDIFFVAFKMPNLFRRIFAEGSFSQSFLPSFIRSSVKGSFASFVGLLFSGILFLWCLFVALNPLWLTKLLAYGFDEETLKLCTPIVAINFWYLLLVFITTFLGTLLQYKHSFFASAYSTSLLNLCMILALVISKDKSHLEALYYLSYGVLLGGVAQILLHFYPLVKLGLFTLLLKGFLSFKSTNATKKEYRLNHAKKDLKSFFKQFFPSVLGNSTAQIASFLDTTIASFLASGSVSYLYYANRVFQLPLALFAIAISTALFPSIAIAIKNNEQHLILQRLQNAWFFLVSVLLFCSIGGIMLSKEITQALFERGHFSPKDTLITSQVFSLYLLGLLPFGLSKLFSLWLYAKLEQAKAAKISLITLLLGLVCSLSLMPFLGVLGLALSNSLSGFILFTLTIKAFGFRLFLGIIKRLKLWLMIIFLACVEILLLLAFKSLITHLYLIYYFQGF